MDKLSILCLLLAITMHCQADEETEVTGLAEETEVTGPAEEADEGQEQEDGEEQEEQGQEEEQEQDQPQIPALDQALGQVQVQKESPVHIEEPGQEQEEQEQEQELDQDQDQEQGQEQDVEKAEDLAQEQEEGEGQEQERRAKQVGADEGNELVTDPEAIGGLDRLRQANNDSQPVPDEPDHPQTTSIPDDDTTAISGPDDNFITDDVVTTTTTNTEGPTTQRTFIQLLQEPECLNEGGLCGLYETCPECMRGRPKLCPKAEAKRGAYRHQKVYDPRRDAAVCCFGMPVMETRCWKKKGVCINIHEYCPHQRLFVNATDCGDGKKCCMSMASEHQHTVEY